MAKKPRSKSPPSSDGPSLGPWRRLAVTLLAPVAVMILSRFGPSFVDTSALSSAQRSSGNFSVFALGVMPFITASVVVEFAAAIVPRWTPLRHGGPVGRQKLWRATLLIALVLCLFQASDIARLTSFAQEAPGLRSTLMIILTLTAGAFLLCFVAQLIGAYGLSGGFGLLMATSPIFERAVSMVGGSSTGTEGALLSPLDLVVRALLAGAAVAVTWYALRPRPAGPAAEPRERAYRAPPVPEETASLEIPVPASGTAPLIIAMSLLAFPATLVNIGLPMKGVFNALNNDTIFSVAALILIAALSAGFSWVFNQPSRIAALRGGGRATADLEAEARAELFPAMARTVLFCVVLFGIDQIEHELSKQRFPTTALALALLTAVALDINGELRARLATPDLVPVWPEHRPYAVAVARGALRAAGIPVHARDERLRRMYQFYGPFVPIELLVPRADAKRAAKVLSRALSPARKAEEGERVAARPRPAARRETRVFAAISLAVIGLVVARPWSRPPPQKPRAHAAARALELTLVDDDDNDVFTAKRGLLPEGASLQVENAPAGPGRTTPSHYVRILPVSGETLEQARARFVAWAEHLAVPAGEHVALARVSEFDEEKNRFEMVGWRTYLLKGQAAVTGADVEDAVAVPDISREPGMRSGAHVAVKLTAAGAARFAELTRTNLKRRLAIVLDGTVESAPVILSEIQGGYVQITMGQGDQEELLAEAQQLARALRGDER